MVVEDVAVLVTGALLTAARAERLHRLNVPLQPGGLVERMNGLLVDVIAR
jgi:hypothetical protein